MCLNRHLDFPSYFVRGRLFGFEETPIGVIMHSTYISSLSLCYMLLYPAQMYLVWLFYGLLGLDFAHKLIGPLGINLIMPVLLSKRIIRYDIPERFDHRLTGYALPFFVVLLARYVLYDSFLKYIIRFAFESSCSLLTVVKDVINSIAH